MDIKEK